MSLWDFSRASELPQLEMASRVVLVSTAILRTRRQEIFGVGLARFNHGARPLLLSAFPGFPDGLLSPDYAEKILHAVAEALGTFPDWLKDFMVWRSEEPRMLATIPGELIVSPIKGTIGCEVQWGKKSGFITAGHVGQPLQSDVFGRQGKLGKVVYTNNPIGHGTVPEDDVAVVEYAPQIGPMNPRAAVGSAKGGDGVAVVLAKHMPATIMGYCHHVWLPSQNATLGDTYFTTNQVTHLGDSGAQVHDSAGRVIGHVVAASEKFTTYIQDVRYQVQQINTKSTLTGLHI
jgi:hypothetical protein